MELLDPARLASLGSLHALPDSLLIECIMTLVGPKDLLSLALTSRYLNAFARNDYVWKRLFFSCRDRDSTRIVFRGSWFLTYLFPTPDHNEACANHPLVKHPLPVQGVTSPYLSQQWHRGHLFLGHFYPPPPLPPTSPAPTDHHSSPRSFALENYDDLDQETFDRRYRYPNRPLMIQNSGVEQWPAWEGWTLDALAAKYGDTLFRVSNIESDKEPSFNMRFDDFLHYIRHNSDTDPLYLFDPYFAENVPEMDSAYKVPKYFEFDYFSLLKADIRPPYRWLLVGPQRTGAPWHIDPSGTSAWNTLLSGHKRWALYPPHTIPPGHDPTSSERMTSVSWYLDVYPHLPPESLPLEIVQCPGQTIYVPSGWWHMVINMDDTVAVTHNFADEANLLHVKRSLLSESKETTQLKRWELLEKEIGSRRPDLIPALTFHPDELLIPGLADKEPQLLDVDSAVSLSTWRARTQDVLQRAGIDADVNDIKPVLSGRNICFLAEGAFVKFFTPYQDGLPSYLSEVAANQLLMDDNPTTAKRKRDGNGPTLSSPRMLGHGYYSESSSSEGASPTGEQEGGPVHWRRPYIITETVSDMSLFHMLDYLPKQQVDESFLASLMDGLQYYHTLNLKTHTVSPKIHELSRAAIPKRLKSAYLNHARWRIFPKHLLDQISDYLPTSASLLFNPHTRGDIVASLVHGDVNPSNILGTRPLTSWFANLTSIFNAQENFIRPAPISLERRDRMNTKIAASHSASDGEVPIIPPAVEEQGVNDEQIALALALANDNFESYQSRTVANDDMTPTSTDTTAPPSDTTPSPLRHPCPQTSTFTASHQETPSTFKPTTMIDYGDALVNSDPLIDYVSVFITILNGRRDSPSILAILLDSWRRLALTTRLQQQQQQRQQTDAAATAAVDDVVVADAGAGAESISLARRCMWHVLLWPSEGMALHLTRCVPEIGEMDTWQDVEQALFGWWYSL
ncbi:hypothetical protein K457DRAFT_141211 [Linnemannia elongata AG-77]|uniref:JmjC domain-containing protein n=1 Tax=Linnemannia elongata AG-77 TaxID=1314771 RepID=A0A197JJM8_9FUNG|nr:hypothetical protein K457DRAFT_141211 [Linnemannia elongata AG-77]